LIRYGKGPGIKMKKNVIIFVMLFSAPVLSAAYALDSRQSAVNRELDRFSGPVTMPRDEARDFRAQQRAEEIKVREEERLRKIGEARERAAERQQKQAEAAQKREELRLQKLQQRQEKEQREVARKFFIDRQKAQAEREQEQRKLADFIRQRQSEEAAKQRVSQAAEAPATILPQPVIKAVKNEPPPPRQEKKSVAAVAPRPREQSAGIFDRIQKLDKWVRDTLW
jgi:hypothetical protein